MKKGFLEEEDGGRSLKRLIFVFASSLFLLLVTYGIFKKTAIDFDKLAHALLYFLILIASFLGWDKGLVKLPNIIDKIKKVISKK